MTRARTALSIILIAAVASSVDAQSPGADEELRDCAKVSDRYARLACYDSLSESLLGEQTNEEVSMQEVPMQEAPRQEAPRQEAPTQEAVAEPETVVASEPETQPLPDDFGKSDSNVTYSGMITACRQGHYGDWYFVFDNGQVWKETNNRRLRFKECNFKAKISKDGFGYRLTIEGEEKTYRVRRHQ